MVAWLSKARHVYHQTSFPLFSILSLIVRSARAYLTIYVIPALYTPQGSRETTVDSLTTTVGINGGETCLKISSHRCLRTFMRGRGRRGEGGERKREKERERAGADGEEK